MKRTTNFQLPLFLLLSGIVFARSESATDKLRDGDKAIAGGQHTAAVRHYSEAIELDPKSPLIFTKRAAAYVGLKKFQQAIEDLTQAILLDAKNLQALLNRGKVHKSLGSFDQAKADFDAVLELKPGHKSASQELASLFRGRDSFLAAKRHIEIQDFHGAQLKLHTAATLLPDCPGVQLLQAELLFKQGQHERAVADLGKVLKADPGNIEALMMRGWSYLHLGDEETGTRHFREILRYDPEHSAAKQAHKKLKSISKMRAKAQEAMDARDYRSAESNLLEAVQVEPTLLQINLPMIRELCRIRTLMGQGQGALDSCDSALRHNGEFLDCAINKVKALMKLERFDEAANFARALAQKGTDRSTRCLGRRSGRSR
uniref:DnaJ homolog subfamily C member 3 n=1 Tax=Tetraselmis sp. GSL018 TaxID=582737 RepID=A0A061RLF6_9CHLO